MDNGQCGHLGPVALSVVMEVSKHGVAIVTIHLQGTMEFLALETPRNGVYATTTTAQVSAYILGRANVLPISHT